MAVEQNYSNHVRWYPLAHFVVGPLLLLNIIWQGVRLYQEPSWNQAEAVVFAVTVIMLSVAARLQALKAQDRVIRLEEQLRFNRLLSPEVAAKAANLDIEKLIALRFASDVELPELLDAVLEKRLHSSKEIKTAIKAWRGDYLRV